MLLLALPSLLAASPWAGTFGLEASTYFDANSRAVMVIAAGSASQAPEAASALIDALRLSGGARVVMGQEALGNVSSLSDREIVDRAKSLAADRICIVRVFPQGEGRPPSAVGTVFQRDGTVLSAFTVDRGQRLSPRASVGEGVSSDALSTVQDLAREHAPATPSPDAQKDYDERYLGFQDGLTVDGRTGAVVGTWSQPVIGKYRRELEVGEFFETVGRPDLASSYRVRHATRLGLVLGGGGGLLLALGLMTWALIEPALASPQSTTYSLDGGLLAVSAVLGGASLIAMLVGIFISTNVAEGSEVRRMADEYNQRLKQQLHLTRAEEPARVRWAVALLPVRDGAGVGLAARF